MSYAAMSRSRADQTMTVPEILQGTLPARVAQRRILFGHAHQQLPDLGNDTGAAGLLASRALAHITRLLKPSPYLDPQGGTIRH